MTKDELRRLANVVVLSNIAEKWGEADSIALSTLLRELADEPQADCELKTVLQAQFMEQA